MDNVAIAILAAGKGTRMESDLPKVLVELSGKPLLEHLLERLKVFKEKTYTVVGYEKEKVEEYFGPTYHYIEQKDQLGTGHAVAITEKAIPQEVQTIVVLYGDMPFTSEETVRELILRQQSTGAKLVMGTVTVPDFLEWRKAFSRYGRIVRDSKGELEAIVEARDASPETLEITEVNPALFAFNREWLFENLKKISPSNSQHEYYLTDLLKIAHDRKEKIETVTINPESALGANTLEELEILTQLV